MIRQATRAAAAAVLALLREFRAEGLPTVIQHARLPVAPGRLEESVRMGQWL